jgi:hypothetical protein
LDENGVGEGFAQGDAGVANLANDIVMSADEPNLLIFNQAKFAQTVADSRLAGELFHANARTDLHVAQRTHRFAGALALHDFVGRRCFFVHGAAT